jgi:hypothetical protein
LIEAKKMMMVAERSKTEPKPHLIMISTPMCHFFALNHPYTILLIGALKNDDGG